MAGDHSGVATAGADGKWRVDLAPFAPGTPPFALVAMSKNQARFEDVLVGDVWLASGQSNMEYCLRGVHNIKEISDHLEDQQLRVFMADHAYALEPASDVRGHWEVASRESLSGFSAIAYFFGHDLRQSLNRPIGLVESSFGGTVAESWTSISGLEKDPPFTSEVAAHAAAMEKFQSLSAGYGEKRVNYQKVIDEWDATDGQALYRAWAEWRRQAQINRIAGKPVPRDPEPGRPRPPEPADPLGGRNLPGSLFNGMIAPLIPFAIKGVIWHQGEFNADRAAEYRTLFPRLISDWREKWGQGDFPFLFVQLAALGDRDVIGGGDWPLLQEAQFIASRVPNTGIATSIDIGDRNDIHPADKLDVGLRLARIARHRVYGQNIVDSGPVFAKMTVEGHTARITFTETGGGLVIGSAPWTAPDAYPIPATQLVGFVIAGADQKFAIAEARIEGNVVVVSSAQVPNPVAVRYDFANITTANLYNKEGLPAFPFRTDTWDKVNSPAVPPKMIPEKTGQ